ncbi:MAG: 5'-3' exonuclease H3TH domain-containing protein [Microgenomates group bacterium]
MNILLVVDGNGLMHRAYHALPPFRTAKGIPTHVVYGFFSILYKAISDFQPTHLVICFDTPAKTFRNDLNKEYQSQRPKIADDFIQQIPMVKEVLDAGNIIHLEKDGYEGDDVIGTVTKQGEKEGFQVLILTGDKDMMQLINEHVSTVTPDIGFSKTKVYTEKEVIEKMGVPPKQIIDLKSLCGDPSDNYKGADGIGPKTAQKLLQEFQTVDNILDQVENLPEGRVKENIKKGIDDIKMGKQLATILTDIPISFKLADSKWIGFIDSLREKLLSFEMYSLAGRLFPKKKKPVEKKAIVEKNKDQISMF